jgi:hypothetical protein
MSTAAITLETSANLKTTGQVAIVFQPLETADFHSIVTDMEEVVKATNEDSDTKLTESDDTFGYRWMIFTGTDFEELVVAVNAVSSALDDGGYGERILCAVFPFKDEDHDPVYIIYNYKRGAFYPFVPLKGDDEQRNNEEELRLKVQIGPELPFEKELERWFPLWGIPI